ncbi:MAG: hypothetical protein JNM19_13465 [Chitinophagaceae bacterium]|nr:hypothetical protein [Chitinophagaceae bacterium]
MNKKMLTIILGALLILGFFLPYISFFGQGVSGFDLVKQGGKADVYVLLLSPIAGILLLVGALNNGKYVPSRGILVLLALIGVLYLIIRSLIEGGPLGAMFKLLGIGYYLSLAAAVVLAIYNPKE